MPSTDSPGRTTGVLARRVAGPLVLVVAIVAAVVVGSGPGVDAVPLTGPSASVPQRPDSSAPTDPATNDPATSAPSTTASTEPSSSGAPGDPDPTSGGPESGGVPGVDVPGISMTVTPQADGTLDVKQTVWLDEPSRSIDLSAPDLSDAGDTFARKTRLTDLTLTADGRKIPLVDDTVTGSRTLQLSTAASAFSLSYTLRNAVVRSKPSVAGRALGAVRPLTLGTDPDLPLMVDLPGDAVLSLVCPDLGSTGEADCAGPSGTGYRLSRPVAVRSSLLIVQLDLDRAAS